MKRETMIPSLIPPPQPKAHNPKDFLQTVDLLWEKAQDSIQQGKLRVGSVNDLVRLLNVYVLLTQMKNAQETRGQSIDSKLADDLLLQDPMVAEVYAKLFDGYNQLHDQENRQP